MEIIGKSPVSVPELILGKAAMFGCWLFAFVPLVKPEGLLLDSAVTRTAGTILFTFGLVVVIVALAQLGWSARVGIPTQRTELKTRGLYRFSRNPIYVGAFLMCVGSCLYAIHPVNFILAAIAVAVHLRIVEREEEFLSKTFGDGWLAYKKRVPRFIGKAKKTHVRAGE